MIAKHKGEVPFLVYLLPFITGIIFSISINPQRSFLPFICFLLSAVSLVCINKFYGRSNLYKYNWLGGLLLHLAFFTGGMVITQLRDLRNSDDYFASRKAEHLIVKINTEPALKGKYWHFNTSIVATQTGDKVTAASGNLMLTILADSTHTFKYGDEWLVPANYKPADPPFNPAAFSYKNYLANQHIYEQSFLFPGQFKIIDHNKGNPVIAYSLNLRQQLVKAFTANIKDTTAAAVATTLILGYKANLSPDIVKAYSKTGTIHVLSVSGAHVAIVYVFITFLLGFLGVSGYARWVKTLLSILLIWAYAMLTGFSPPVCRAAIMLSTIIIGRAGYQHVNPLNLLAFSAFILLLYDPLLITDIGFQLSYLAVFGLVVLQPVIYKWFDVKNKWLRKFWYLISASLAAQIITFPLSAFYFHQFPLYFLISNLFIIIPSEVALFCGILAMLFGRIAILGKMIYSVLEYAILFMNKGLVLIEQQPYASIDRMWFSRIECTALFIGIMALFYFMYNRRMVMLKFGLICFLFLTVSFTIKKIKSVNNSIITFFDISKHTAILFKDGNKGVLLTDLKAADTNYIYNIKPAIDSLQINSVQQINVKENLRTTWFKKTGNLLQYRNTTLVLFNKGIENFVPPKPIKTDYIYLTGNPQTNAGFLKSYYHFKEIIIDPANSASAIKRLSAEAKELKINIFVLKRNKSLIVTSN